ncbi:MAG: amidohydrolase family protein [Pirellulales bacterium]
MIDRLSISVLLTVVAMTSPTAALAAGTVVFRGARILTATEQVLDPGCLVVRDGKIVELGPVEAVTVPADAEVHDVTGKVIIPGLVDTHSHIGVFNRPAIASGADGNEMTGPVQTVVRALDSLNPFDPGIPMATAGGVTTANVMPGSGNVIGGQTIYVKLRGHSPEQMWISSSQVLGGLKMANGENPKKSYGPKLQAPGTRMKIAALQRAEFVKAQEYLRKWNTYRTQLAEGKDVPPPSVDLGLEPLVEVLQKKRTVHFHTHRADDILTTLRLRQEFGFELVIQHGTETYKVVDEIAKAGVPVSMTLLDSPGGKAEVVDFVERCGAELHRAGVKVLINTDDPITESRFLLRTAAIAVRGGLPESEALRAITLHAAQAMHLEDRIGSLEPGKDADLVVLSGAPFSVYTRVLETYIDGQRVFALSDDRQRLYQTGGFSVLEPQQAPTARPLVTPPTPSEWQVGIPDRGTIDDQTKRFVVLAGEIHTVAQGTIQDGAILVEDGKIAYVGPRANWTIPDDVPVTHARTVTPGLIDAHSVVPLMGEYNIPADQDGDENSDPQQASLRVLDAFNPAEPLQRFLLRQGVTVVHACPGRLNAIAGQTGVFRTHGKTADSMVIRFPHGMMFNLGVPPKTAYPGRFPSTRMGTAGLIRKALGDAAQYVRGQKLPDADKRPERNLAQEALADVLAGKTVALFCAQRADDLLTATRLTKEFNLQGTLALASDGYLVADQLAAAKLPVIVHPTMQRVGDDETYRSYLGNAADLSDKGLLLAISSGVEDYVPKTRVVRQEAAVAMVYGLGFERALRSVTLDAAKILKIDDRYGSLEVGKVADLVLYDGDPFEYTTRVQRVFVGGESAYDAQAPSPAVADSYFYDPTWELPCCLFGS